MTLKQNKQKKTELQRFHKQTETQFTRGKKEPKTCILLKSIY